MDGHVSNPPGRCVMYSHVHRHIYTRPPLLYLFLTHRISTSLLKTSTHTAMCAVSLLLKKKSLLSMFGFLSLFQKSKISRAEDDTYPPSAALSLSYTSNIFFSAQKLLSYPSCLAFPLLPKDFYRHPMCAFLPPCFKRSEGYEAEADV